MTSSSSSSRCRTRSVERHAPPAEPGLAPGPQHLRRAHPPLGRRGDDVELGIADAADAEVLPDVDRALLGQPGGALEQPQGGVAVGADEVLGDVGHLLARLQVALGGAPVDVPRVERDQPAGGVQHVGGRGVEGVDVADGVAEHHRHALLGGEPEHRLRPRTGRPARGGGRPRAPAGRDRTPPARCRDGRRRGRRGRRPAPGPPGSRARAARSARWRARRPSPASSPAPRGCRADGWRW